MSSNNAKTVFLNALEITSPEARREYLAAQCGNDAWLRAEVEELLRHHEQIASFGESASALKTESKPAECSGMQIGPYKLLQQIGEGGMGVVYMAEQKEPVERLVALKIVKPGMDTKQVIARFEAERQALAMMDHPNIAKVLDAGTTRSESGGVGPGSPYFVMELVHGVPITKYCDEHRLTLKQRLELFLPVCQAVQHAHQKGIIHRDLKPSNVLVARYDDRPVPKVIDFGVAKAAQKLTDRTMFTEFGQVVGTLEYMSPEQARFNHLDIDTRSDIYSLGVLLYELLTGCTPFDGARLRSAAFDEILRIIREEEPPKPSTRLSRADTLPSIAANRNVEPARLGRSLRGELDWIVMKALEKDRNRRYETTNGLARDIQQYLQDEPVQACPPSALYRLRKMVRRNKRALATVTVLISAILAMVGIVGWAVRGRVAREAAVQREAEQALQEAGRWTEQAKWPEALSAAKRAEGLLAGANNKELRERVHETRKELEMVVALEAYRAQRTNLFFNQPKDSRYARLFTEFGVEVENLSSSEVVAQIARRPATAIAVASALDDWAQETQDPATSLRLLEIARLADPDPWRSQLRHLMGQKDLNALHELASAAEMSKLTAQSLQLMGHALAFAGDRPASIAWLRRSHRQYPGDSRISFDLAFRLAELGTPADLADALRFAEAALASRSSPAMYDFVGNTLNRMGRHAEAIACARKAIEIAQDDNWDDNGLGEAYKNLGEALVANREPDEAIQCFEKAIELKPTDWAYKGLGEAFAAKGNLDKAINCYHKSIELNPGWDWPHCNLGDALAAQGKVDDAIVCYRKAIELDPQWDWPRLRLATVLERQAWALANSAPKERDEDRAVLLAKEASQLAPEKADYRNTLGAALYRAGHWQEAISELQRFRELRTHSAEQGNPLFLAMAHWQAGNKEEARQWYDKGVAWMQKNQHPEDMIRLRAEAAKLLTIEAKQD